MDKSTANQIWGAPKKFSTEFGERKISWLELFYDLVYVIAISKITHFLETNPCLNGLLDYCYFFGMIFWGWLNGSLYHDIHGSPGIRTRFITLWQMLLVTAFVATIKGDTEHFRINATIALLLMQLFVTYLWWSIGFYDKSHRALNRPYTIFYLISSVLIFVSLFLKPPYLRYLFYASLACNYLPPFLLHHRLKLRQASLDLSPSMTERLGLFTIILFGEAITGIVTGTSELEDWSTKVWMKFALGIIIVFALWWIFFGLIAGRENKKGTLNGVMTQISYIPTLMSLSMIGAGFTAAFEDRQLLNAGEIWLRHIFGCSLALCLIGISCISYFLYYPNVTKNVRVRTQLLLCLTAFIILILTFMGLSVLSFLGITLALLIGLIIYLVLLGIKFNTSTLME